MLYTSPTNYTLIVEEILRYQELAKNYNVENIVGGATHNSIKVAQWMLQVPGATSYMGGIGKDKFGEEMKKNSKLAGVNVGGNKISMHLIYHKWFLGKAL
ncbi:hypothetical protein JHK87_039209 [Glycine soja]|nr:hypothetical protein JHK87_039209 [Glycine soja]